MALWTFSGHLWDFVRYWIWYRNSFWPSREVEERIHTLQHIPHDTRELHYQSSLKLNSTTEYYLEIFAKLLLQKGKVHSTWYHISIEISVKRRNTIPGRCLWSLWNLMNRNIHCFDFHYNEYWKFIYCNPRWVNLKEEQIYMPSSHLTAKTFMILKLFIFLFHRCLKILIWLSLFRK